MCRRKPGSSDPKLPEERTFSKVVRGVGAGVFLFACAFAVITALKASRSPHDITANWFVAWGTWAGGLGTAAAFLIAAINISVTGAHTRFDRREAAQLRADDDMAQARLLTIYRVEDEHTLESLPTFRIENRSKDTFFDVTVPYVDSPYDTNGELERRTADLVAADNRLHEFIPTGAELTAYRDNTEHELWFTLVTVHTIDASRVEFEVRYTDANGRRWSQQLGGGIERITTSQAVQVRPPDRFQPRQQIRRLSKTEAWRRGFTSGRERPQTDDEFLTAIGTATTNNWERIARIGDVDVRSNDLNDPPDGLIVAITFRPIAPPFWADYFHEKLAESGLNYGGGISEYEQTENFRLSPDINTELPRLTELFDAAIEHANNSFEQTELAAAMRALDMRR